MTHVQKLQAYTCLRRFHVFVYYHYPDGTIHVFFALNQWVLDSKLANEWHEKFSFCESMRQQFLCRIFHVLKYKWSSFLASFFSSSPSFSYSSHNTKQHESRFSSCQSKSVLWDEENDHVLYQRMKLTFSIHTLKMNCPRALCTWSYCYTNFDTISKIRRDFWSYGDLIELLR